MQENKSGCFFLNTMYKKAVTANLLPSPIVEEF